MAEVAIYKAPRASRRDRRKPVSEAAHHAMQEARRMLYSDEPGLVGDAALAERERYRREDEGKRLAQGELPLGGGR